MRDGRLAGKVVLVTGGAGGIGAAIVRRIAAEGASAVIGDINTGPGETLAAEVSGTFITLDVTAEAQWRTVIERIEATHGRLDGLVNNAGINCSIGGETPADVVIDDLRTMTAVNVEGMVLGCKHGMALIARSGGGAIVNMASIAGDLPCDFIAAYGATKAAVAHWTRSVALHCARTGMQVRCNSVHPGSVLTPMMDDLFVRMGATGGVSADAAREGLRQRIPLGAYQAPEDIANAVLFLLSEEARAVTGIALPVDGGMLLVN